LDLVLFSPFQLLLSLMHESTSVISPPFFLPYLSFHFLLVLEILGFTFGGPNILVLIDTRRSQSPNYFLPTPATSLVSARCFFPEFPPSICERDFHDDSLNPHAFCLDCILLLDLFPSTPRPFKILPPRRQVRPFSAQLFTPPKAVSPLYVMRFFPLPNPLSNRSRRHFQKLHPTPPQPKNSPPATPLHPRPPFRLLVVPTKQFLAVQPPICSFVSLRSLSGVWCTLTRFSFSPIENSPTGSLFPPCPALSCPFRLYS